MEKDNIDFEKIIKKNKRVGSLFLAAGTLFVSLALGFFIISDINNSKNNNNMSEIFLRYKDLKSSQSNPYVKQDSVLHLFLKSMSDKNLDDYISFYSDTVSEFYLLSNISQNEVRFQVKWYWGKFSDVKKSFDFDNISYTKLGDDTIKAFISGRHFRNNDTIDVVCEIRLNGDNKIFYIRDFIVDTNSDELH